MSADKLINLNIFFLRNIFTESKWKNNVRYHHHAFALIYDMYKNITFPKRFS